MLLPENSEKRKNPRAFGAAALAYLGDAVYELIVREHLIYTGISDSGKLNKLAASYVKATEQSRAFARIEPHLTEEELAAYKRGRNVSGISIPHSATATEYRRATGLEALFAYLYLAGEEGRLRELFKIAFPDEDTRISQDDGENLS